MKTKFFNVLLLLVLSSTTLIAQSAFWVAVVKDQNGVPLPSVEVDNVSTGNTVRTDVNGQFSIEVSIGDSVYFLFPETEDRLVIVDKKPLLAVVRLRDRAVLQEAVVEGRAKSARFDKLEAGQILEIGKNEFRKAACCNLSESFDNTPSIDVSYSDGLTGMKQIQLLGLQMSDIFMTMEGMPYITGISTARGLSEIPATWVESMQLSKGIASVVNGMEGNAGQLNIELKKPLEQKGLEFNVFQNTMGRTEFNANGRWGITPKLNMALLTNVANRWYQSDQNNDGFLDRPLGTNLSFDNKWQYYSDELGIESQLNLIYSKQESEYGADGENTDFHLWQGKLDYERKALTWKLGKFFEDQEWKSIGFQFLASQVTNNQNIYFNAYDASQTDLYANLIYQTVIINDKNILKLGANLYQKKISETFINSPWSITFHEQLDEKNAGAYAEYTYKPNDDFTLVLGNRFDLNSVLDFVYTPRLHFRYRIKDLHTLKAQFGKATKINSVFQENLAFMNSTRFFSVYRDPQYASDYYSLPPQVSWNAGFQFLTSIPIKEELLSIALDYQRTWFTSGYLRDFEYSDLIVFTSLPGDYISQVIQFQADMDVGKSWSFRAAYRWNDVRLTYRDLISRRKPLVPISKSYFNVEYHRKKWNWSHTFARTGAQRLSDSYYPDAQVSGDMSPAYFTYSSQLMYLYNKQFEIYVGGENITGFTQKQPVYMQLDRLDPLLESALIWGPINKQIFYLGINVNLNMR